MVRDGVGCQSCCFVACEGLFELGCYLRRCSTVTTQQIASVTYELLSKRWLGTTYWSLTSFISATCSQCVCITKLIVNFVFLILIFLLFLYYIVIMILISPKNHSKKIITCIYKGNLLVTPYTMWLGVLLGFFIIPNPNPRTSQTWSRTVRHKDDFVYTWRDCCFGYLASKPAGMFTKLSYDNGAS